MADLTGEQIPVARLQGSTSLPGGAIGIPTGYEAVKKGFRAGDTVVNIEPERATVGVTAPADGVLEIAVEESPELVAADAVLGYVDDQA